MLRYNLNILRCIGRFHRRITAVVRGPGAEVSPGMEKARAEVADKGSPTGYWGGEGAVLAQWLTLCREPYVHSPSPVLFQLPAALAYFAVTPATPRMFRLA